MRVLIVDDDKGMGYSIQLALAGKGITCDYESLGRRAFDAARLYNYDLIILDYVLDDTNGFNVIMRLRATRIRTPIMIVSGLISPAKKIQCLESGADDCMQKPVIFPELVARVEAIVRRAKGNAQSVIRFDNLLVNFDNRTIMADGELLKLTPKEYTIFEILVMRRGTIVNKKTLLHYIYSELQYRTMPDSKIVDVFVCKLRKKLMEASRGINYIETIWGTGYIMKEVELLPLRLEEEYDKLVKVCS